MKKKIFALTLVLMLAMCAAAPALAAELHGSGSGGSTVLTYSVASSFTVTVPETIGITTTAQEKTVSVSGGGLIAFNQTLTIAAASANKDDSNGFRLLDENNADNYLLYTVTDVDTPTVPILSGDTVLTADATQVNQGCSEDLSFKLTNAATSSGTYKDTITFTVTVTES